MIRSFLFRLILTGLLLLVIGWPAWPSAASKPHPVNVYLDPAAPIDVPAERLYVTATGDQETTLLELRRELIRRGARRVNLFLPSLLVFEALAGLDLSDLLAAPGLRVTEESLISDHADDRSTVNPVRVRDLYKQAERRPTQAASARVPAEFWHDTFLDKVIIRSPEEVERVQNKLYRGSPSSAQKTTAQNSEFMIGDILVQLVFPESNGQLETSTENWSDNDLGDVVAGSFQGMLDFQEQYSYVPINMIFRTFERVDCRYEPVKHNMNDDHLWINDVLATLGYNDGDPISSCHRFNNDGRKRYKTDWVFTAFVANSENSPMHRFNTTVYTAYANLGGPYLVMPFPAGENPYDIDRVLLYSQIFQHETCHIFWALDEYPSALGDCGSHTGYLDIYNKNKWWYGPNGGLDSCQTIVPCIMARAKEDIGRALCGYTDAQMGAVLTRGTSVPRVFDSPPVVQFEVAGIETVETDNLTIRFKAFSTAVPNKNPFQQPENRIDYAAPLKDGMFNVDGVGQVTILPDDGKWDETEEDLSFSVVSLRPGLIQFAVRVRNSVGRSSGWVTKKIFNIGLTYSQFFIEERKKGIFFSWQMVGETFDADFDLHRVNPDGRDEVLKHNILPADTLNDQFLYFAYLDQDVSPGLTYQYYIQATYVLDRNGQDVTYRTRSGTVRATAMVPLAQGSFVSFPSPNPFNPTGGKLHLSINVPKSNGGDAFQAGPLEPGTPLQAASGAGLNDQATAVRVDVYDVTGRRVNTLYSDRIYAGILTVDWDGTSRNRRLVPTGVYFLRVKAGNLTEVRKVLIVR